MKYRATAIAAALLILATGCMGAGETAYSTDPDSSAGARGSTASGGNPAAGGDPGAGGPAARSTVSPASDPQPTAPGDPGHAHGQEAEEAPTVIQFPRGADVAPDASSTPIGTIDTNRPAPPGLELSAGENATGPMVAPGMSGSSKLAAGWGCEVSCIQSGAAFPAGFGAELVVETSVPTTLWIGVVEGVPGLPLVGWTSLDSAATEHHWTIEDLEPGSLHHVTVAATDSAGNTDHAFGDFTTLSTRTVVVELGDVLLSEGLPRATTPSFMLDFADRPRVELTPGNAGIPLYRDVDRYANVRLMVHRRWTQKDACEVTPGNGASPTDNTGVSQGVNERSCVAWNGVFLEGLDLDVRPEGAGRWTRTSFTREMATPTSAGGAFPAGYGDPWWFDIFTTATFHVTYS